MEMIGVYINKIIASMWNRKQILMTWKKEEKWETRYIYKQLFKNFDYEC